MIFLTKLFLLSTSLKADGLFDPLPEGVFEYKLPFDPTLFFFLFMGVLYFRGLAKYKRPPVASWQVACFVAGLFVLVVALMPPIDPWSDRLFFVHMVQHIMISHIGVPLMIFGVPFVVILRGIPFGIKKAIYFPILRRKWLLKCFDFISQPIMSLVLFTVMYLFWHIPYYYNLALLNDRWHLVEHASIAITSMLLWRNLIDPKPMKSPLPLPGRLLFIAIIMACNIVLSALLTFAENPLYAYQGIPQPSWWTWGYQQDQQLGGLLMWVGAGIIELIMMTICFFVWVKRSESESESQQPSKM